VDNIRVRLIIEGRVQGVWFRESTRREAERLGVRGWVRNRREGSVEVVAEGPEESVRKLVDWCHHGLPRPGSRVSARRRSPFRVNSAPLMLSIPTENGRDV